MRILPSKNHPPALHIDVHIGTPSQDHPVSNISQRSRSFRLILIFFRFFPTSLLRTPKNRKKPSFERIFYVKLYFFSTFLLQGQQATEFFADELCWWVGDGLGCQQTDIDCLPCPHEYWYPLDFLPNYPARKCFIIYVYEAGTVLMIFITTASLPSRRLGWTKMQFAFEASTAKALFAHDRSVGVSVW